MKKKKVSPSSRVRMLLETEPPLSRLEVISILKREGVKISDAMYYNVKGELKRESSKKTGKRKKGKPSVEPGQTTKTAGAKWTKETSRGPIVFTAEGVEGGRVLGPRETIGNYLGILEDHAASALVEDGKRIPIFGPGGVNVGVAIKLVKDVAKVVGGLDELAGIVAALRE